MPDLDDNWAVEMSPREDGRGPERKQWRYPSGEQSCSSCEENDRKGKQREDIRIRSRIWIGRGRGSGSVGVLTIVDADAVGVDAHAFQ